MKIERVKYPCTNECLVKPSCTRICDEYKSYVELVDRWSKYHCFGIDPEPPRNIKELVALLGEPQDVFTMRYQFQTDSLLIACKREEKLFSYIKPIRFKPDIHSHKSLPIELKEFLCGKRRSISISTDKSSTWKRSLMY